MKYKIKKLMQTDVSKLYIMGVIIFCLILLGSYFSYAMFTVNKEKNRAISIVTGTLEYELKVNDNATNTITVPGNSNATYTINLNNINSRDARLNFYYIGDLPSGVDAGYIVEEGTDIPPTEKGEVFSKAGSNGDKKVYKIKVKNTLGSSVSINLGVQIGLDYNDLSLPSNGHLFTEYVVKASDTIIENVGDNGGTYDDGTDTFITGTNPNNYVWYSGKLWRAVSINNEAKTIKLITEREIATLNFNKYYVPNYEKSYMEEWLNDTSVDGFLGNLREPEKFIETNAKWDATADANELGSIQKPNGTTIVEHAVGLLNLYEYQSSYHGTNKKRGYLNNGFDWWVLTPTNLYNLHIISTGESEEYNSSYLSGVRPSIVLKNDVKIVSGSGTESDPYRLSGDDDTNLNGVKLNTRYSGEYIKFGTGKNNLYRIVSHETEKLTKITSNEILLEKSGEILTDQFGGNTTFSTFGNNIGGFLNIDYINSSNEYLTSEQVNMIDANTVWYQGTVDTILNYKLAKYANETSTSLTSKKTIAKVGLLRYGELMTNKDETWYWTITPQSTDSVWFLSDTYATSVRDPSDLLAVKPAMNLKENVVINSGDGTKNNPFTIELSN